MDSFIIHQKMYEAFIPFLFLLFIYLFELIHKPKHTEKAKKKKESKSLYKLRNDHFLKCN